jgi:hypothetical protein
VPKTTSRPSRRRHLWVLFYRKVSESDILTWTCPVLGTGVDPVPSRFSAGPGPGLNRARDRGNRGGKCQVKGAKKGFFSSLALGRQSNRLTGVRPVEIPVATHLAVPAVIACREDGISTDRALPALLISVEKVDREGLPLGESFHKGGP